MDLENYIYEPGSEGHPSTIKLETKTRQWIKNEQYDEFHPLQHQRGNAEMDKNFSNIFLRSSTAVYNCHGMVFAARRTAIYDPKDVEMILNEDGFAKLENRHSAERGDVVVYRLASDAPLSHTGIIVDYVFDEKTKE